VTVSPYLSRAAASVRSLAEVQAERRILWQRSVAAWNALADDYEREAGRCTNPTDRKQMLDGAAGARLRAVEIEERLARI